MIGYEDIIQKLTKEEKEQLKTLEKDIFRQKRRDIEDKIRIDQRHRELVNLCIHPFKVGNKIYNETGLSFVCVDPLYDKELNSFDIFIYSIINKAAILIECKPLISNPRHEINDVIEKINVAISNKNILESIVGDKIEKMEFVICTLGIESDKISSVLKSMKQKPEIIVWYADSMYSILKINREFKKHSNSLLNELLSQGLECLEATKLINFLPSSHMCTILQVVSAIVFNQLEVNNKDCFRFSDLCEVVKNEIRNYPDDWIVKISEKILESGIEVGIFEKNDAEIRLNVGRRGMGMAAEGSREKYIIFHAKEKVKEEVVKIMSEKIADRLKLKQMTISNSIESKSKDSSNNKND